MKTLILTEKPSVAREIAKVLGNPKTKDGYIEVNQYVITWAVGHLVSLAAPEQYKEEWKSWSMDHLPMIPEKFKLSINKRTAKQFKIVKELMVSADIARVIFATDAGPEGELIARWIYQKTNCRKPVDRLWISSLTFQSIQEGMKNLRPAAEFDSLFYAAVARARADWLVGLNATRAVTSIMKAKDQESSVFSVGRVQSPTLRKVVERCLEIKNFVPETFFEIIVAFQDSKGQNYKGRYFDFKRQSGRIETKAEADKILSKITGQQTNDVSIHKEELLVEPPQLFSLPLLQQKCSSKFGISVAQVDEVAQDLYEKGLITYPRTAYLIVTPDVAMEFPAILTKLSSRYKEYIPEQPRNLSNHQQYVGLVSDHHAIIPTGNVKTLNGLEEKVYDLIAKTFIAAHHQSGIDAELKINTIVNGYDFLTTQSSIITPGWRAVFGVKASKDELINQLFKPIKVLDAKQTEEQTTPPPYFTEAALIKEMERHHLGTPATRSSIIENLKQKKYIINENHSLVATEKAKILINHLFNSLLISESMTSQWENKLENIRKGILSYEKFNHEVNQFIQTFVEEQKQQRPERTTNVTVLGKCPKCYEGNILKIAKTKENWFYGCNQKQKGCSFFVSGEIAGTKINDQDIVDLLTKGHTKTKTFQFKNATKKSQAQLTLKANGQTEFVFKKTFGQRIKELIGIKGG